jgi:hypothetical protein
MLNVKTLTDTMSRMELPQLQQYAALHKNDPYIVTLALSIANQKKQMKTGQDGQAGMMPQPKVADQEIAQMNPQPQQMAQAVPEDQGIGTLPAQNMQNMAGGGIVAFANEGFVDPAFTYGIESEFGGLSPMQKAPLTPAQLARYKLEKEREKNMALSRAEGVNLRPTPATDPRLLGATPPAETVGALPAALGLPPAAPPIMRGVKSPAPAAAAAAAPVGTAPAGLPALNTKPMSAEDAMAAAGKFGDDKAMREELQGYVDRQKKIGEEAVGSFQQGIAGLPEAYKKYEARLQKEEAEAATDKDKAVGMSIFKAGLAMMSGTSQNAFENIGKGAMVGLEDQQAALKDFKKAQRERDKAFGDIEAARLADQRGDLKTKLELENRAADRNSNAEGKMVEGIAKLFDTNKTNARGIYQTGFEQANQNQRTQAQINADMQRQSVADKAAMERTNAQVAGSLATARLNADTYKLPMLYKSVEDSVDKMLQADMNYKVADEATKATMRNAALQKRLLATPGLAQYAGAPAGGAKFLGFENPK